MAKSERRNLITDIAGLAVGNAEDVRVRTGVTVLTGTAPFEAVIDVRGASSGTCNADVLRADTPGLPVDAIVLSGGSVYGLEAPAGAAAHLAATGRGLAYETDVAPIPLVPGAILFDLANGGNKDWGDTPPYRTLGRKAAQAAGRDFALGNAGAGYGARAGAYKGGLGSASATTEDGLTVGALVAVNAVGSPIIPGTDCFWAWTFERDGEFGGRIPAGRPPIETALPADMKSAPAMAANTTIAIVATDAKLSRIGLKQFAVMATDGFARALRPVHTPYDGDLAIAVTTAEKTPAGSEVDTILRLGSLAADTLARAIARGVYEAETLGTKSYRDTWL